MEKREGRARRRSEWRGERWRKRVARGMGVEERWGVTELVQREWARGTTAVAGAGRLCCCRRAVDADAAARSLGVPREKLLSRERCGIYLS